MKFNTQLALALGVPTTLAIPPADFGFPTAANDTILSVAFSQHNGSYTRVDPGILFGVEVAQPDALNDAPQIAFNLTAYESLRGYNGSYIIFMVDPDASYPQTPTNRFILHYMQANLTIDNSYPPRFRDSNLEAALPGVTWTLNNSAPFIPFNGPQPPTNSSAHRYILYAFRQPDNFQIPSSFSSLSPSNRTRFQLTQFISDASLGDPVAANYFYASSQSSVPGKFLAAPGGSYPGGNGEAVTSGDPGASAIASSTISASGTGQPGAATSTSSPGVGAKATAVGNLMGAGIMGLIALI